MCGSHSKCDAKKVGPKRAPGVVLSPFAVEYQEHLVRQIFEIRLPNPQPLQGATKIVELEAVGLKSMLGRRAVLSLAAG